MSGCVAAPGNVNATGRQGLPGASQQRLPLARCRPCGTSHTAATAAQAWRHSKRVDAACKVNRSSASVTGQAADLDEGRVELSWRPHRRHRPRRRRPKTSVARQGNDALELYHPRDPPRFFGAHRRVPVAATGIGAASRQARVEYHRHRRFECKTPRAPRARADSDPLRGPAITRCGALEDQPAARWARGRVEFRALPVVIRHRRSPRGPGRQQETDTSATIGHERRDARRAMPLTAPVARRVQPRRAAWRGSPHTGVLREQERRRLR
jgi:hypothetical protein